MSRTADVTPLLLRLTLGLFLSTSVMTATLNTIASRKSALMHILYPKGVGESKLSECDDWEVCSRVDTYSKPWMEKLCSCKNGRVCPTSLLPDDGYTLIDRTRQHKMCEPVDSLPTCGFFHDVTWTYVTGADNHSKQLVHCRCPPKSFPYFLNHEQETTTDGRVVVKIHFACSPQSMLTCGRKEPCRLFSVRKRFPVQEVTTSPLCKCSSKTSCPVHHMDPYVVTSDSKSGADGTRTYVGYCGIPSSPKRKKN